MLQVLIVDDETNIRRTLAYCLTADGNNVTAVSNPTDAIAEARQRSFDLAFIDIRLGDQNGMDLVPVLLSESPWLKIVIITAYASIESAVDAIKAGASDYLAKPFTPDQVRLITSRIKKMLELESELAALKQSALQIAPEKNLSSKNAAMKRIIETARKAAGSEAIILLQGESGTGKSVFARAIHNWSPRAAKPVAVIACPAVPAELLESELFGHVKGAFTGAIRDNPGRLACCEGGTLFLDEIGDMAPTIQAKLLRFLQDKEYERLGDSTTRKADVRIIAATNSDLAKKVADGTFREDLFYRLNVISLTILPLRQRKEDIVAMAKDFLTYFCKVNHKKLMGFTENAEKALVEYNWPGNVRELRNAIERAVILGSGGQLECGDLPYNIGEKSSEQGLGEMVTLARIEELHIRKIIASTSSLQEAADILGIDQATLWRRRKTYGI